MKKILSLALVSVLVFSLAGCGEKAAVDTTPSGTDDNTSVTTQDPYTVKLMLPGTAKAEDCAEIARLASAITVPKFNTTIEIARAGFGSYSQEVNLMFSSGEKLDMLYNNREIFVSAVNNGQIVEIGQYFDEYAPDLKSAISDDN